MTNQNYTRSLETSATPKMAYTALTRDIDKWWTESDGMFQEKGDTATFTFPPKQTYWTFEAIELTPNLRIVLKCVDAHHIHDGLGTTIKQEWDGTTILWSIEPTKTGCKITMVHEGLEPQLLCYDVCEAGWDYFFQSGLSALLNTGKGTPHSAD